MPIDDSELARSIIAGTDVSAKEALELTRRLHKRRQFGPARKMLAALCKRENFLKSLDADPALKLVVGQRLALSTYKDPDVQLDWKYEQALSILQWADPLGTTKNQETLGLAGAVNKLLWEYTGRESHLEASLAFYRRGYVQGVRSDFGYTAINAALILDVLADLETLEDQPSVELARTAGERRDQSRQIREEIVKVLVPLSKEAGQEWLGSTWWFLVTVAEAYFGLEQYDEAEAWLMRAQELDDVADWERESTARQFAKLLRVQERVRRLKGLAADPRAEQVLANFLGHARAALDSVLRGRVGLALSGGGFRASLYHIGVLARLAELDLLRHVEYLSCVSGGSIIGAHYYLEVRKLLSEKEDARITKQDYIDIVTRVCDDFLAGVQRNIRTRIAAEWLTNLKMIFLPHYSRTMRAGDLYESEIYARVKDGAGDKPRWLNELRIYPKGEGSDFRPKDHNWRRAAKVPILVLNATSLNTGHNWQFTASWMGEPPAGIDWEVDANYRLRRMYYDQAPEPHNRVRLGHAVAASACVPGLFEPLTLANLYERMPMDADRKVRPVVRLVDGGVHDNQGTAALLEQGCSVLLVSDASGQMSEQDKPGNGLIGVPLRANSILQARVRVSQFEDLESRRRAGTLKGFMFVHLKKDLETRPVDWINCQDPSDPTPNAPMTVYGIQKTVQRRLAAVRTDLDSFSDAEAYALMTSGYLMTNHALQEPILGFATPSAPPVEWKFLQIEPAMRAAGPDTWLQRQLRVADKLAFKVWYVARQLQVATGVIALILIFFGIVELYESWDRVRAAWGEAVVDFRPTLRDVVISVGLALLSVIGLGVLTKILNYRKTLQQMLIGIGMATIGFVFARLHLHVFDRLFLWQGRLKRPASRERNAPPQTPARARAVSG